MWSVKNVIALARVVNVCMKLYPFGPWIVSVSCEKPLPVACGLSSAIFTLRVAKLLVSTRKAAVLVVVDGAPPLLLLE